MSSASVFGSSPYVGGSLVSSFGDLDGMLKTYRMVVEALMVVSSIMLMVTVFMPDKSGGVVTAKLAAYTLAGCIVSVNLFDLGAKNEQGDRLTGKVTKFGAVAAPIVGIISGALFAKYT